MEKAPTAPMLVGTARADDGTPLHYSVLGPVRGPADGSAHSAAGTTFVCCDGIGCDGFIWKYLARDFCGTHRIVRWHYRGHGQSGRPVDPRKNGILDHCADLAAVLDATETRSAVVLGHSMGVQVALEFHRRFPMRVEGLVLICGSHGRPLDTFHDSKVLKLAFPRLHSIATRWPGGLASFWRFAARTPLAMQIALRFEVNARLLDPADFAPYFDHLARMDPQLFLDMLEQASQHDAWDHLPDVDVPTLVVAGTQDTFTPYWLSEEMADRIPGAELLTLPAGTHVGPLEHPELLALRLEKWLEARLRASSSLGEVGS